MNRLCTITSLLALTSLLISSGVPPQHLPSSTANHMSPVVTSPRLTKTRAIQDDNDDAQASKQPEVSEPNIKLQMRLAFRPTFEQLKSEIGTASVDQEEVAWQEVQGNALILAELTARLNAWPELSVFDTKEESDRFEKHLDDVQASVVKRLATELYQATREEDFDRSKTSFANLVEKCNLCHAATPSWSPVVLRP